MTWVCLVYRFREDGRLLGTVRSTALTVAVVLWTAGMAALASGLLLPHASSVPPAAVGAMAGLGMAPKGRSEQRSGNAVMAVLTLGNSLLLHSLALRLRTDRADWCHRLASGFPDCWDLGIYADSVRHHLLLRVDVPGRPSRTRSNMRREIAERYKEVRTAAQAWATLESEIENACQQQARHRTHAEILKVRRAFGEAQYYCERLLELAHAHGKRSNDTRLLELKKQHMPHQTQEPVSS
ncbi:hypothetical protein [Streptomyces gobiensis]|uniref:hypothetical protein n=1 Tax=Streptomyces gobiensis TaxID=2875706 RepID=UPI001E3FF0BB|nr:hypothetical protein [Streptomyces gobiensis]UGY92926.1 hypothetical protein test1122_15235 [Streptomyces gobiensis]